MLDILESQIKQVQIISTNPKDPVLVRVHPANWRCIGVGNSAAAFQPKDYPQLTIKVYANEFVHIAGEEAAIYRQLGESSHFPCFFGAGANYICIGYRPGRSVYDCLAQGIFIPAQVVADVEAAIAYARGRGLNPSDIHSKNIIVHEGHGFLIDVSDYRRPGECQRWPNLRQAYYDYYLKLYHPGFTIPPWVLEIIRKWYRASESRLNLNDFAEWIIRMFF